MCRSCRWLALRGRGGLAKAFLRLVALGAALLVGHLLLHFHTVPHLPQVAGEDLTLVAVAARAEDLDAVPAFGFVELEALVHELVRRVLRLELSHALFGGLGLLGLLDLRLAARLDGGLLCCTLRLAHVTSPVWDVRSRFLVRISAPCGSPPVLPLLDY